MQFESKLSVEDWKAFNEYVLKHRRVEDAFWGFFKNLALGVVLGLVIFTVARQISVQLNAFLYGLVAGVWAICVVGYFQRKKLMRRLAPREDGYLLARRSFAVDETGIAISSAVSRTNYSWKAFESGEVNGELLMLFLDTSIALLISLREVDREPLFEQIERFAGFKIERKA